MIIKLVPTSPSKTTLPPSTLPCHSTTDSHHQNNNTSRTHWYCSPSAFKNVQVFNRIIWLGDQTVLCKLIANLPGVMPWWDVNHRTWCDPIVGLTLIKERCAAVYLQVVYSKFTLAVPKCWLHIPATTWSEVLLCDHDCWAILITERRVRWCKWIICRLRTWWPVPWRVTEGCLS